MREEHIPLFALESQEPVKEFDFLGITLGYEMCYTNVLQILDLSHISLLAKDRKEDCLLYTSYKPKFHCRRQSGMNFGYVTVNGVNSNDITSGQ